MANADAEGNRTVEVSGDLDGTDIGSTLITILPAGTTVPNTSPLATDSMVTTEEDTDYTFSAGDFNFTDADAGDDLASVTVVTLPAAGALALDGMVVAADQVVEAADIGKLVFTPAANANGDAYTSFTFRVSDGTAESVSTYTMTVNVTPVNDAPTGASNTVTTEEDTDYTFSAGDFDFTDADAGDDLASVTVVTLPAAGALALDGMVVAADQVVEAADIGTLVFTPAANANGDAYTSFTFRVSDGTAESVSTYTMTVNVTPVNDAPTGASNTVTTEEDTDYTFSAGDFNFTDADAGDDLASVTVVTLPAAGALALDGMVVAADREVEAADIGTLVFTPAANANGDAYTSFTFRVSDGTAESVSTYTMTVNVTPVNDAPTGASNTVTTDEDTDYTFSAGDFDFTDADAGDDLASVTVVTLPAAGALKLDGAAVAAGREVQAEDIGTLVFTPAANANGDAYVSFTFRVSDGDDESVLVYTLTLDVTPVNDPATGVPTIGGMAWPGGTLTADTSGVDDADGMTGVTLAYQWTRLDPEGVLNPVQVGTDSRSYAPEAADIGSNIAVTVSFTDDGNNVEELTSAAVGPVVAEPVTVTIAANHDIIGAGLEDLVFTLTRDGATADALDATVDISQEQEWLDDSELSHTVTFLAGESTATLKLRAYSFSSDPDTKGDLTATVSGLGISGDSDTVQIVSTPEPPITLRFDKSAYTFAENGVDAAIYAVATLHPDYPRAPSTLSISVFVSSQNGTAETPEDYDGIHWQADFIGIASEYVHDVDIDRLVARKPVPGFSIVNDVTYEGSEHFTMIIERGPGIQTGRLQVVFPNGTTCDIVLGSIIESYASPCYGGGETTTGSIGRRTSLELQANTSMTSETSRASFATTGSRAAVSAAASTLGSTALTVVPLRS